MTVMLRAVVTLSISVDAYLGDDLGKAIPIRPQTRENAERCFDHFTGLIIIVIIQGVLSLFEHRQALMVPSTVPKMSAPAVRCAVATRT